MFHARWVTTANRIRRLYVATEHPSSELITLTKFVLKVYTPAWLRIKQKHSCIYGAKIFFEIIQDSRYLDEKLLAIIDPVLQRNAYFAYAENLLLSMIFDDKKSIRQTAFQHIMAVRSHEQKSVKKFECPVLNFKAKYHTHMINLNEVSITEPPLLRDFTIEEFNFVVENGLDRDFLIYHIPCHTQAVKRAVKDVSAVSKSIQLLLQFCSSAVLLSVEMGL